MVLRGCARLTMPPHLIGQRLAGDTALSDRTGRLALPWKPLCGMKSRNATFCPLIGNCAHCLRRCRKVDGSKSRLQFSEIALNVLSSVHVSTVNAVHGFGHCRSPRLLVARRPHGAALLRFHLAWQMENLCLAARDCLGLFSSSELTTQLPVSSSIYA